MNIINHMFLNVASLKAVLKLIDGFIDVDGSTVGFLIKNAAKSIVKVYILTKYHKEYVIPYNGMV